MTEDDFGSAANGMRYASNGIVPCLSRMGSLIELDLSRAVIPDNTIPDFAFSAFISLETIRLPVGNDAWYFDSVKYVYMNGLMTGVSSNIFAPSSNLTTAMLMTILARHAGIDTYNGSTWYEKGMAWGIDNEITDGTNIVGNVTRQRFVTILYRYAVMLNYDVSTQADLSQYKDAGDIASWAFDAMSWAVAVGLVNGRTDATIAPLGYTTRAEAATLLQRFAILVEAL